MVSLAPLLEVQSLERLTSNLLVSAVLTRADIHEVEKNFSVRKSTNKLFEQNWRFNETRSNTNIGESTDIGVHAANDLYVGRKSGCNKIGLIMQIMPSGGKKLVGGVFTTWFALPEKLFVELDVSVSPSVSEGAASEGDDKTHNHAITIY
jgi:hypothetical protein